MEESVPVRKRKNLPNAVTVGIEMATEDGAETGVTIGARIDIVIEMTTEVVGTGITTTIIDLEAIAGVRAEIEMIENGIIADDSSFNLFCCVIEIIDVL